eukprot:NODE_85_length_22232_cov_1.318619.p18 type:complete len:165 gc:universal NODE_85_length_22232_cov_1.318619:19611-19117(-)
MFGFGVSYIVIFVLLGSGVIQIRYLNKAMSRFNSTQVIPIQFVLYTLFAIISSAILFNDFDGLNTNQMLLFLIGCSSIFIGVYIITSSRQMERISSMDSLSPSPTKPLDISFEHRYYLGEKNLLAKSIDSISIITNTLGNQSVRATIENSSKLSNSLPKYPIQL